jgi:hypothetical protein
MSIKVGIYDFFAYTIPGGIVVSAILFILIDHFGLSIDIAKISLIEFFVLITIAYLIGYANDFVARRTWIKLFYQKNFRETMIAQLNKSNPWLEVDLSRMDWYVSLMYIRKHNLDLAQEIDKLNVQNVMLRNSSFGILIFAVIFGIDFFLRGYLPNYAIASVFCVIVSVILARESRKFSRWFYHSICQVLVALVITPEQLPLKVLPKAPPVADQKNE